MLRLSALVFGVRRLAEKLTEPEARKALLRNGQLDPPPKEPEPGQVRWADKVQKYKYQKLTKEEYEERIIQGIVDEPLAPKGEKDIGMQVVEDGRPLGDYKEAPHVDCSRIDMTVMEQLRRQAALELEQERQVPQHGL